MWKKLRLLFSVTRESEAQSRKRIKLKQQALAEQLKQTHAFQQEMLNTSTDTLDLS